MGPDLPPERGRPPLLRLLTSASQVNMAAPTSSSAPMTLAPFTQSHRCAQKIVASQRKCTTTSAITLPVRKNNQTNTAAQTAIPTTPGP